MQLCIFARYAIILTMQEQTLGLRDRKRLETRARLEAAAVSLALEGGIEHATVDAISERADVSSRTFFNYFDSKEDAILGIRDIEATAQELAEHAAGSADAISAVVGSLFHVIGPSLRDTAAHHNRMEIIKRFPQLLSRQIAQMTTMTEQLTEAVQAILAGRPGWGQQVDVTSAEMMLGMCFSAVHISVKEWLATGSQETPQELEKRTIALIRQLHERIA
jgi:AcrR family transcriptional regulator